MRFALLSLSVLTAFAAAPASALTVYSGAGKVVTGPPVLPSVEPLSARASNITASDTRTVIAPALPSVDLGPNATGTEYLLAAQSALAANQTGLGSVGARTCRNAAADSPRADRHNR